MRYSLYQLVCILFACSFGAVAQVCSTDFHHLLDEDECSDAVSNILNPLYRPDWQSWAHDIRTFASTDSNPLNVLPRLGVEGECVVIMEFVTHQRTIRTSLIGIIWNLSRILVDCVDKQHVGGRLTRDGVAFTIIHRELYDATVKLLEEERGRSVGRTPQQAPEHASQQGPATQNQMQGLTFQQRLELASQQRLVAQRLSSAFPSLPDPNESLNLQERLELASMRRYNDYQLALHIVRENWPGTSNPHEPRIFPPGHFAPGAAQSEPNALPLDRAPPRNRQRHSP